MPSFFFSCCSFRSQEETLNHQRPQYIKAKVNTSHHQRKVEEVHSGLLKAQRQQAKKEQELQELKTELAELEKAWTVFESEIAERAAQRGEDVQLEEAQVRQTVGSWAVFFLQIFFLHFLNATYHCVSMSRYLPRVCSG